MRSTSGRYCVPLLLPGLLAVLSVPLSVLASPPLPQGGIAFMIPQKCGTLTSAMYLCGGFATGPSPFPLGWYWTGVLAVTVAATVAWIRRCDRLAGTRTSLRGFGLAGLTLTVMTAALPLLGWRTPVDGLSGGLWTWLDALWRQGTFALASVTVLLAVLSWMSRSWALALTTMALALTVGIAGWLDVRGSMIIPVLVYPYGDPAALLPGAVLTVAGLAAGTVALARARRQRADADLDLAPR